MVKRLVKKAVNKAVDVSLPIEVGKTTSTIIKAHNSDIRHVESGWRTLVHVIPEEECSRATLQLWTWLIFRHSWVILRPCLGAPRVVIAYTLENTRRKEGASKEEVQNELPITRMCVHWADNDGAFHTEDTDVPNAYVLKYWHDVTEKEQFLLSPLPEHAWNGTRELPEAPGVNQPYHACSTAELRAYLKNNGISPKRGDRPVVISDWDF